LQKSADTDTVSLVILRLCIPQSRVSALRLSQKFLMGSLFNNTALMEYGNYARRKSGGRFFGQGLDTLASTRKSDLFRQVAFSMKFVPVE